SVSLSTPDAVLARSFTFFLASLKWPSASGPFKGTASVRPLVQTFVVAGTSAESAVCRDARSGSVVVPRTLTDVTSAGVQVGSAGSGFRRQTSTSNTHASFATPSASHPTSPSKQRSSFAGFGWAGSKGL